MSVGLRATTRSFTGSYHRLPIWLYIYIPPACITSYWTVGLFLQGLATWRSGIVRAAYLLISLLLNQVPYLWLDRIEGKTGQWRRTEDKEPTPRLCSRAGYTLVTLSIRWKLPLRHLRPILKSRRRLLLASIDADRYNISRIIINNVLSWSLRPDFP